MWQNKPNYYTIRTANLVLLILLSVHLCANLLGILYTLLFGSPSSGTSPWLTVCLDVFLLLAALFSARPAPALRLRAPKAKNIVSSLLLAFFAYLAVTVLIRLLYTLIIPEGHNLPPDQTQQMLSGQPFWVGILLLCVLAPLAEEAFFRGMLQSAYERRIGPWAILFSSVVFGLMHVSPLSIVSAIPLGLLMGWLYVKTRSLWCPVLFHALFNLLAYTLAADYYIVNLPWVLGLFPADTLSFTNPFYAAYAGGIAAIGILMTYVLVRLLNHANPENKAQRSSAYRPEYGQLGLLLGAVFLLALRVGMGAATFIQAIQ